VFLDGEHYIRDLQAAPILEELQKSGAMPPATCVFVSHVNAAARHEDYVWNNRYADFIANNVVCWANPQVPTIQTENHLICGLSLSGLAAAQIALRHPDVFSHVLCQSGSFWWLADHALDLPATQARFWLSVGDEETATEISHPPSGLHQRISQIEGVKLAAMQLEALGAAVKLNLYPGGHAAAPWKAELSPALRWLFES